MLDVYVSCGVRKISKSEESLEELFINGVDAMLLDYAEAYPDTELDAIVLTSAHPVELNKVTPEELCDAVSEYLEAKGIDIPVHYFHKPGIYTEEANLSASAAGAALLHEGIRMVGFDGYSTIGLVAAEQMRTPSQERCTDVLRSLLHPEELKYGVTMPALAALFTDLAINRDPSLAAVLTSIASQNHTNGASNPRAHIKKAFTVEEHEEEAGVGGKNIMVSSPLRLWDVAPRSAGYAALVMSDTAPEDEVRVKIAGYGQGIDTIAILQREDTPGSLATLNAMEQLKGMIAFSEVKVRYAEIHDAFPLVMYRGLSDIKLLTSDAKETIVQGDTSKEGALPLNLSGGLLCGHALAASGLGQIVELTKQAKGDAEMKIDDLDYPHFSFALSVGGFNTYSFVTLLYASRDDERSFSLEKVPKITKDDFDTSFPTLSTLSEGPFTAEIRSHTTLEYPPSDFDSPLTIALCFFKGTETYFLAHSSTDELITGATVVVEKNEDGLYTIIK